MDEFSSLSQERRIRIMLSGFTTGELHTKVARLMVEDPKSPIITVINEILNERSGA
jgi:hypothetical protein